METEKEEDRPERLRHAAPAAFGAVLGLLSGLAASSVAPAILSILGAASLGFLEPGARGAHGAHGARRVFGAPRHASLLVFSVAFAVALLVAIPVRTYNLLGPSLGYQADRLEAAGVDREQALQYLLRVEAKGVPGATTAFGFYQHPAGGSLFAGTVPSGGALTVDDLAPDAWASIDGLMSTMHKIGGAWGALAEEVEARFEPSEYRDVLTVLWRLWRDGPESPG